MKAWNRESRELKLRYDEKRATINLEYSTRQVQLSHSIDMARNRVHYLSQTLRQPGADLESVKAKLDGAIERLREMNLEKVKLDYERKNAIVALDRQRNAEIDNLETKYGLNLDVNGEEVVAV